jgi:hypothetical protein
VAKVVRAATVKVQVVKIANNKQAARMTNSRVAGEAKAPVVATKAKGKVVVKQSTIIFKPVLSLTWSTGFCFEVVE